MLVFYEAFAAKQDAVRREKYLKSTKGKRTLKLMLKDSLAIENCSMPPSSSGLGRYLLKV